MKAIGIDPGVNWSAGAVVDTVARTVTFFRVEAALGRRVDAIGPWVEGVEVAAVEGQQIRHGERVNPQDIVDLALEAGRMSGMLECAEIPAVLVPKPQQWKGSVPKAIHNQRVRDRLAREGYNVGGSTLGGQNHYWDAAGLALWALEKHPGKN